ncbi:YceG-like family protein [Psychrobacillus sp. OK028]|uniref:endolytic transglycosylase MltG n=1 Tax=Psychrobacillus sp. OK028 TaxID=1884359 RepID=UPI00088485D9|nr:endolytic transglycosylase MltG [Psychrobacillus sp. OK028]SDM86264.1 YceG-like family protein [Psychrobacillus sp. OK028]
MNKTIRNIGIGLFLAGAAFQIEGILTDEDITSTNAISQESYDQAQQELTDVKKQLAQLQLDLNSAQQAQTNEPEDTTTTESPAEPTTSELAMTLSIQVGMTSSEISAKLQEEGIIQNSVDLDNYLSDQGLAGRIQVGNYELTPSMSLKQIAETITR